MGAIFVPAAPECERWWPPLLFFVGKDFISPLDRKTVGYPEPSGDVRLQVTVPELRLRPR